MFKKKGGPAFKPKIPSARSRPVARPAQPILPVEPEPTIEKSIDQVSLDNIDGNPSQSGVEENASQPAESLPQSSGLPQPAPHSNQPLSEQITTSAPPPSPRRSTRTGLRRPAEVQQPTVSQSEAPEPASIASEAIEAATALSNSTTYLAVCKSHCFEINPR